MLQEIVQFQRSVGECFHLFIPNDPFLEMQEAISNSMLVESAVKQMLSGEISPEELLEMVEPVIENMDDYIQEVEENLIEIYLA
ncbi:MAG: hypothetical protein HWQ35_32515 [Nostoc sp. NMS1]|uniref:hypothetical protein n=1 Tax=unclassified Nostoc TaxID=2593658 RepID=UPI0025E25940|nr:MULTISPECIES: hypothetical protein [unclassified Nostoc]MBN3911097.1 hypothetical protein [Nostoc sp. NMS1]MBN3990034.1 hypothetical protein [Nostoc sp. NMS2]